MDHQLQLLECINLLRSRAEDAIGGLDIPEMGTPGYVAGDTSTPWGEVAAPVSGGVTITAG